MVYNNVIRGKNISLYPITQEDSEFIISLRTDAKLGKYLNPTSTDIEIQRKWIEKQQEQEGDYYFSILDRYGKQIGLVSLYNVNVEDNSAELGRWISIGNAVENLESVYLLHKWGFEYLKLKIIYTCTVKENIKVINFWKRFGATFTQNLKTERFILSMCIVDKEYFQSEISIKVCKMINR